MKPSVLLLATALLLPACDGGGESKPKTPKHTEAEVKARADEVYAAFEAWHDNLPEASATKTCDDAKIEGFGTEKNRIEFLAYQSLRSTVGEPWDGNNSMVRFMTDGKLRYRPRAELDLGDQSTIKQLMRMWGFVEYVGVVVPTHERKSKAHGSYVGSGGAVAGQLVIYRNGEPEPLCYAPFQAVSSGDVSYRYEVGANSNDKKSKAAYALKKKTCADIKKVLLERVGELSKTLKPGLIDCNAV